MLNRWGATTTRDMKLGSMSRQSCVFLPSALLKFLTICYSSVLEEFGLAEELKRFTGWMGGISPAIKDIILWELAGEIFKYSSTTSHSKFKLGF